MAVANGKGTVAVIHAIQQVTTVLTWFRSGKGTSPYLSVSQRADHRTPYLASILLAVRAAFGLSQTEVGTNLRRNGEIAFPNVAVPGASWFSLIANVEQGGRKTAIPATFLDYLAAVTEIDRAEIQAMADADTAIMAGFGTANRQANRNHGSLVVCQECGKPLTEDSATAVPSKSGHGFVVVHKTCPTA